MGNDDLFAGTLLAWHCQNIIKIPLPFGRGISKSGLEKSLTSSELLPQPQQRKQWRRPWGCCPCPGSPSFPRQIRLAAALCLRRKAFSCSKPNFSQIRKHVPHSNRMCFLNWLHFITSSVHETSPFDLIKHLFPSSFLLYHLLSSLYHPVAKRRKSQSKISDFFSEPILLYWIGSFV